MTSNGDPYDVIVIGAGNAALCAALSAREHGARVAVLEKAPPSEQGGNCPFTGGGFRFTHDGIGDLRGLAPSITEAEAERIEMGPYTADDFRNHLTTVTRGETAAHLMEVLVAESRPTVEWMASKGVEWELGAKRAAGGGPPSTVPNAVGLTAIGSGAGLVQMLTRAARQSGIDMFYETKMQRLLTTPGGSVRGVEAVDADGAHELGAGGVVLACGGFEGNAEMRAEHMGANWSEAKVRGSRHNTGDGHRAALEIGAAASGCWDDCHCTPIDADAPATGQLAVVNAMPRRAYPLGITVNLDGHRFADEGTGFAEQTFVDMGRRIMQQRDGAALQIFDARAAPHIEERYGSGQAVMAESMSELAKKLRVNASTLEQTVGAFNETSHEGEYDPLILDGKGTRSLNPPKSNWAIRIDKPPFTAYRVTCGITYTYGGLAIDAGARVLDEDGRPIQGLYAAGEIVGGIFRYNSLRAAGLMHGAVFGRIGGANAAKCEPT